MQAGSIQSANSRIKLALAALLVLAAVGWLIYRASNLSDPGLATITAPIDLDRMEPQLQAYLREQIGAASRNPLDPSAQARLGLVYAANQLWKEAAPLFANASKLNPKDPLPLLYQGVAAEELGDQELALRFYEQTAATHPRFPQGHWRLGDLSLRLGHLSTARAAFEKVIELSPGEWRGHAGLGHVFLLQGTISNAIARLETAVRLDPKAKSAHHLLGLAYRDAGRPKDAERELRRGQDGLLFPMPDAWNLEAPTYMRLPQDIGEAARQLLLRGDLQEAATLMATSLAYRPDSLSLLLNFSEILLQGGKPDRALELLKRAEAIDPAHAPLFLIKSSALLELGKLEEALADAERAAQLMPSTPKPLITKAQALGALGRFQESLASLQAAHAADPKNALIEVEMGDIRRQSLHEPHAALSHYHAALRIDPDLIEAHLRIAEVSIQLGLREDAASALDAVREIDPMNEAVSGLHKKLQQLHPAPRK